MPVPEAIGLASLVARGAEPSRTYTIDPVTKKVMKPLDGIGAVRQAVEKIFTVERFRHLIYSPNYGQELGTLVGASRAYIAGAAQKLCEEALGQDNRITGLDDFAISFDRNQAEISFAVHTVFGNFDFEWGFSVG